MTEEPLAGAQTSHARAGLVRGFLDVRRVNIPRNVADAVHEFLRQRGSLGVEAVAFWAGVQEREVFNVLAPIIPEQEAQSSERGLAVVIRHDSLFRMNVELHKRGWAVITQIHSHPGRAYHSDTDNAFSVITRIGGFSIVVPDFARNAFNPSTWSVHRLGEDGRWRKIPSAQVGNFVSLTD